MTTLLIVDDRAINREVLSLLLDEHGYTILEAEDGLKAIEIACNNVIDLIITDIAMPNMDGLTLVKALQADPKLKNIPIIFYSATYKAAEAYRMANASNVKYVLTKPCDPEIILGTIEGALDPDSEFFNNRTLIEEKIENLDLQKTSYNSKKDKLENINMRLTNLIEIGLDMSLEHDIEKLTYILCKGGRQFLNASYAGVILKDSETPGKYKNFVVSEDNSTSHHYLNIELFSEALKDIFIYERGVCTHSPVIDVSQLGLNDISLPFSSLLALPLKTTKRFYGKIYFINKKNCKIFTAGDQRFMMTLADKFAINYENLILYKAVEQHSKQLEEMTERLHLTLEAAQVGTWSWLIQTGELTWDKYACLLFGIDPASFTGTMESFLAFVHPEDRKRVKTELLEISKKDKAEPIDFRVIWPDKSIHHLMLRGRTYNDDANEPHRMLGVYWDITKHIQAEEKLRIYRQQMSEIVRSNSLGEMASSLAHEINQPLAAIAAYIKGCIKRLETKKEVTPEIIKILNEATHQAERAGEVVHRIKNFVRKGELFFENIDVNTLIEQAIQLIHQETQSFRVEVNYNPNKELPTVEVDKIQIQQVIINLLRNAVEAMKEVNTPEPKITIETIQNESNRLSIRVLDNGPGFSGQTAQHLFELYFTTKSQGMGLGLSICRSVIEAHSGQLSASVLPGGGSAFQFDLPISKVTKKQTIIGKQKEEVT